MSDDDLITSDEIRSIVKPMFDQMDEKEKWNSKKRTMGFAMEIFCNRCDEYKYYPNVRDNYNYCPNCNSEYQSHIKVCADCNEELLNYSPFNN